MRKKKVVKQRRRRRRRRRRESFSSDDRPAFFKIIFPGLTTESLRIPPDFVKSIPEETTTPVAILKRPTGGNWDLKLRKRTGGVYLEDGWKDFLRDNSLGDNEFLLFRHDGNMCFEVKIFDKNGCERIDAPIEIKRKRGRPRKKFPDENAEKINGVRERKKMKTEEREKGFARNEGLAESFTSEFPHCKIQMKFYNVRKVFMLHLPVEFCKEHFPRGKFEISLQTTEGKTWKVKAIPLASDRGHALCGGWITFVKQNSVKEDDVCIFELLKQKLMQVHIFRSP